MKFKYLSIFIAIGSLLLLYVLSLFSQPLLIPLSSFQTYNGQQVTVQGIVTDYRTTSSGSQLITIKEPQNSTTTVALYLEGEISVEYGDIIQATGEIQQYNNQWELVINDPQLVLVLQRWQNRSLPIWELACHPQDYLDTTVNVTGIASQTTGSSFTLSSTDGKHTIDVTYTTSCPHHFAKGDTVTVGARLLYDAATCRFLLKATEPTHGIWKTED